MKEQHGERREKKQTQPQVISFTVWVFFAFFLWVEKMDLCLRNFFPILYTQNNTQKASRKLAEREREKPVMEISRLLEVNLPLMFVWWRMKSFFSQQKQKFFPFHSSVNFSSHFCQFANTPGDLVSTSRASFFYLRNKNSSICIFFSPSVNEIFSLFYYFFEDFFWSWNFFFLFTSRLEVQRVSFLTTQFHEKPLKFNENY